MTKTKTIANSDQSHISDTMISWLDKKSLWKCRVVIYPNSIRIVSGTTNDRYSFINPVIHEARNVDKQYIRIFAQFVTDNFIGDERIMEAVDLLLQ